MAMFDTNKKVETKATGKSKKAKPEITMVGIRRVAALDTVIKALTAVKVSADQEVKAKMAAEFIQQGRKINRRPDNFRGVDNDASASCELRARASTSKLSPEEVVILKAAGIPVQTVTAKVDTFVINPAYVDDAAVMEKVAAMLGKIKGLPDDFFLKQDGVESQIVGEGALDILFGKDESTVSVQLSLDCVWRKSASLHFRW